MTIPTKGPVHPTKTQISLRSRSESSLCALWVAKDHMLLQAHNEDTDQTGRVSRLIRIFSGRTCHFVGFVMLQLICLSLNGDIYLKHRYIHFR